MSFTDGSEIDTRQPANGSTGPNGNGSGSVDPRRLLGLGLVVLGIVVVVGLAIGSLIGGNSDTDGNTGKNAAKEFPGTDTSDGGRVVTNSDYGADWPLTIKKGTLRCAGGAVTLVTPDATYALNPEAQSKGLGESLAPVWSPNPDIEGARMSTGALIENGLSLC
ncbi:MAG: DUF2511 domain-containing protein [Microthrixaceae bacterium]|nr:DUF2511 domain-containing protein [Microthrixaceae bacterium]